MKYCIEQKLLLIRKHIDIIFIHKLNGKKSEQKKCASMEKKVIHEQKVNQRLPSKNIQLTSTSHCTVQTSTVSYTVV